MAIPISGSTLRAIENLLPAINPNKSPREPSNPQTIAYISHNDSSATNSIIRLSSSPTIFLMTLSYYQIDIFHQKICDECHQQPVRYDVFTGFRPMTGQNSSAALNVCRATIYG
ncbi:MULTISPECIES: hypothetical protein [unclassified Rhizobium]|uniref:hypothetical protein n=1 Tax=unclassified Rhizobium TaxID=2613769 RepID=UPI001FDF6A88|nr:MULTISPECIES: hypothetical protein [unclassified Rhizobium]